MFRNKYCRSLEPDLDEAEICNERCCSGETTMSRTATQFPLSKTEFKREKSTFVRLEINTKALERLIVNHNLVIEDLRHLTPQTKALVRQAMLETFKRSAR